MDCIAAYDGRWPLQINARKFCGMGKERFCCKCDSGCDGAAQIFAIFREGIECGCCPKIDHACRAAIKIHYRHRICDAVCANCFRVFVPHFDAGLDAYINNKWVLFKIFPAGLYHATGKLRYNRCKADPFQIPDRMMCILQKSLKLQTVFIWHAGMIGGKAPMRAKNIAVVQTQCNVGITNIDCKEHEMLSSAYYE